VSGTRYGNFNGSSNAASRIANLQFESIGSVGLWLKTDDPGLQVSIAMDDPTTGDRGVLKQVIADNQWHKYEWFLDEANEWEAWIAAGNGQIDGENVTIDSIQITGSSDAQVYLDDVFWDPQAVFIPPVPGDFNGDGSVDSGDLFDWQTGFGTTGSAERGNGDADEDGDVDGNDFLIWQRNVSVLALPVLESVPEPRALGLALAGFGALAALRRTGF